MRRPSGVCSIIITLVGLLALPSTPIALYPDLARPQVNVTSTYVGANSDVVEAAVTGPLERELNGADGMAYLSSVSSNEGTSTLNIVFEPSRDIEAAAVDVQNRVARGALTLPAQVNQTGIVVNRATSGALMSIDTANEYMVRALAPGRFAIRGARVLNATGRVIAQHPPVTVEVAASGAGVAVAGLTVRNAISHAGSRYSATVRLAAILSWLCRFARWLVRPASRST